MVTPNLSALINPAPSVAAPAATPAAAPTVQPAPQTDAPTSGAQSQDQNASTDTDADDSTDNSDDSAVDTGSEAENVKVQREFSNINHALVDLADNLGIKRSFTVPYVEQEMNEHVEAVGAAAKEVGGLTQTLLFTFHTKGGRGWKTPDGATVGFNADKLREAIIPADNEEAKTAITDSKTLVNEYAKLLGRDDATAKTAQSQLKVIGKYSGAGMNCLDFAMALLSLPMPLLQSVARAVAHKRHGEHRIALSSPIQEQQTQQPQE